MKNALNITKTKKVKCSLEETTNRLFEGDLTAVIISSIMTCMSHHWVIIGRAPRRTMLLVTFGE